MTVYLLLLSSLLILLPWPGSQALSCGECNHDNIIQTCGPPPSCKATTVLDACGCCPLCAKVEGERCGGPWNSDGSCAEDLVCHPLTTLPPVLGAGGYYSETWDPVGVCVNPLKFQQEHSRCNQLLTEYRHYAKTRLRRSADVESTASDVTTTMTTQRDTTDMQTDGTTDKQRDTTNRQTDSTTVRCVRKPACTPDGQFAPLQCDGCVGQCWCSFHDGQEIKGTRGPYRTVRC